jgi:acyl-CoA thioesterase-2
VETGVDQLLTLLDLEPIEVNIFRGVNLDADRQRVFGGQVAGQALVAAGRTVAVGRVHSLHSYFLRPGDPRAPILYEVDRIRDGRSFTTRRVVAIQHGEAIFNLQCSFHTDETGFTHDDPSPVVTRPEELGPAGRPPRDTGLAPADYPEPYGLEVRFVTPPAWSIGEGLGESQQLWWRAGAPLGDDPLVHAAVATFASDLTLIDSVVRRHGVSPLDEAVARASLDHCMWFHREFRCDDWLLYENRSPVAFGARGLAEGALYDRSGVHVATVAQEGLVRIRPGSALSEALLTRTLGDAP